MGRLRVLAPVLMISGGLALAASPQPRVEVHRLGEAPGAIRSIAAGNPDEAWLIGADAVMSEETRLWRIDAREAEAQPIQFQRAQERVRSVSALADSQEVWVVTEDALYRRREGDDFQRVAATPDGGRDAEVVALAPGAAVVLWPVRRDGLVGTRLEVYADDRLESSLLLSDLVRPLGADLRGRFYGKGTTTALIEYADGAWRGYGQSEPSRVQPPWTFSAASLSSVDLVAVTGTGDLYGWTRADELVLMRPPDLRMRTAWAPGRQGLYLQGHRVVAGSARGELLIGAKDEMDGRIRTLSIVVGGAPRQEALVFPAWSKESRLSAERIAPAGNVLWVLASDRGSRWLQRQTREGIEVFIARDVASSLEPGSNARLRRWGMNIGLFLWGPLAALVVNLAVGLFLARRLSGDPVVVLELVLSIIPAPSFMRTSFAYRMGQAAGFLVGCVETGIGFGMLPGEVTGMVMVIYWGTVCCFSAAGVGSYLAERALQRA